MKKLISKFSNKLLSNQQLKTVKGGITYCFCNGNPIACAPNGLPGPSGYGAEICYQSPCPGCGNTIIEQS